MDHTYWLRQTDDKPLYPDILWSRPESKVSAGKLTVIGGNAHGFNAAGLAYQVANESGIGVCQVVMPDAVKKVVRYVLPDARFAPSTPSGSFSKLALSDLIEAALWADSCILAGDIGRNSETAIVLETFLQKYTGMLTVTQDAVDYFKEMPLALMDRQKTLAVMSISQLQKIFINTPTITPITYSMTTQQLVEALHDYTLIHPAGIITKLNDLIFIAHQGKVCTIRREVQVWRVATATRASVFWLQNPSKLFEAVVSSLV